MEKIYSEQQNACRLAKVCPETVKFLLNYSRSLYITKYDYISFEGNLN
ncbi:hypothetical protein GGR42_000160 [Saonia flava]|uniref:Uncharacterized protein n=1 Tax=Saonia flava TaxID=523696 RepID=A0A846QNJ3_9FLAO|nr:hypothetical protein [Saonia flava]